MSINGKLGFKVKLKKSKQINQNKEICKTIEILVNLVKIYA